MNWNCLLVERDYNEYMEVLCKQQSVIYVKEINNSFIKRNHLTGRILKICFGYPMHPLMPISHDSASNGHVSEDY